MMVLARSSVALPVHVEADVAGRPCSDFPAFKGPDVGADQSSELFVIVRDSCVRTIDDLPAAKIRAGYPEYFRWCSATDAVVGFPRTSKLDLTRTRRRAAL